MIRCHKHKAARVDLMNAHTVSPIDFDTATHIGVKDLGPPDIRHDLSVGCHSKDTPTHMADMRVILNTGIEGLDTDAG